ncbi:MAG: hypothetical protein JWO76_2044 [Nocardioides sp.]|nr:hypothetical protein [Nocardioides sp.]
MSATTPHSSPGTTSGMSGALHSLALALDAPHRHGVPEGNWRWLVRQRMAAVRDVLVSEGAHPDDGWLAARGGTVLRERNTLLVRLSALGPQVLESPDVERVRVELKRLLVDVGHHVQRLHDLAYDEVELELGGSE